MLDAAASVGGCWGMGPAADKAPLSCVYFLLCTHQNTRTIVSVSVLGDGGLSDPQSGCHWAQRVSLLHLGARLHCSVGDGP